MNGTTVLIRQGKMPLSPSGSSSRTELVVGWRWQGNDYLERFGTALSGTDPGWHEGPGTLQAGVGIYP